MKQVCPVRECFREVEEPSDSLPFRCPCGLVEIVAARMIDTPQVPVPVLRVATSGPDMRDWMVTDDGRAVQVVDIVDPKGRI